MDNIRKTLCRELLVIFSLSQSLVAVLLKLIKLNRVFSMLLAWGQIFSIKCITHTNKNVVFWLERWFVKSVNDNVKVVSLRYCELLLTTNKPPS